MEDEDLSYLAEGTHAYADTGVNLDDLEAQGFFDCVTDEHRRKADAYFAKIEAKRAPPQRDLFA